MELNKLHKESLTGNGEATLSCADLFRYEFCYASAIYITQQTPYTLKTKVCDPIYIKTSYTSSNAYVRM